MKENLLIAIFFAVPGFVLAQAGSEPISNPQPVNQPQNQPQNQAEPGGLQPPGVPAAPPTEAGSTQVSDVNRRDPFRLPQDLLDKLFYVAPPQPPAQPMVDLETIEPLKRWPLNEYDLVGIMWDVKNPKALIRDRKNSIHVIKVNDRVGNRNGVVSDIKEGIVVVTEDERPVPMKIRKK